MMFAYELNFVMIMLLWRGKIIKNEIILFERDIKPIGKHINNALVEELKEGQKTVQLINIVSRIKKLDSKNVLKIINNYSKSFNLLDSYDHRCLNKTIQEKVANLYI